MMTNLDWVLERRHVACIKPTRFLVPFKQDTFKSIPTMSILVHTPFGGIIINSNKRGSKGIQSGTKSWILDKKLTA